MLGLKLNHVGKRGYRRRQADYINQVMNDLEYLTDCLNKFDGVTIQRLISNHTQMQKSVKCIFRWVYGFKIWEISKW